MFSVVFPGQGSQSVGMASNLYNKYNYIKDLKRRKHINYDGGVKIKNLYDIILNIEDHMIVNLYSKDHMYYIIVRLNSYYFYVYYNSLISVVGDVVA